LKPHTPKTRGRTITASRVWMLLVVFWCVHFTMAAVGFKTYSHHDALYVVGVHVGPRPEWYKWWRSDLASYEIRRNYWFLFEAIGVHQLSPAIIVIYGLPAILLPWGLFFATHRLLRCSPPGNVGLCRTCGYDLRATPDRCPECGATAEGSAVG
jgi:hypothetical protein